MGKAEPVHDSDKLPWLEPYREPASKARPRLAAVRGAPAKPSSTDRRGVPLAAWLATGVAVLGIAVGGAFWAGRVTAPPAAVDPAPKVTIPVAKVDPIPMPTVAAPAADEPDRPVASTPARKATTASARPAPRKTASAAPPPRPQAAPPMPKVMSVRFSPPPSAGKPGTVVDLGRYLSPQLADSSYRVTVGRYPYLGGLTKVVAPQPVVYGQPRLYALQLGAKTPREARALCDNLKRIGRPCVVR